MKQSKTLYNLFSVFTFVFMYLTVLNAVSLPVFFDYGKVLLLLLICIILEISCVVYKPKDVIFELLKQQSLKLWSFIILCIGLCAYLLLFKVDVPNLTAISEMVEIQNGIRADEQKEVFDIEAVEKYPTYYQYDFARRIVAIDLVMLEEVNSLLTEQGLEELDLDRDAIDDYESKTTKHRVILLIVIFLASLWLKCFLEIIVLKIVYRKDTATHGINYVQNRPA